MASVLHTLAFLIALATAGARPAAALGGFAPALHVFRAWETWRLAGSAAVAALLLAASGLQQALPGWLLWTCLGLLVFAWLFDLRRLFPEIALVDARRASDMVLDPADEVLGVGIDEQQIAFPLADALRPRHLIHHSFGGTPLFASYCALCNSALVFGREIDGTPLYFEVVGVWRRNLVMRDRQTRSLWQQATGDCILGPLAGKALPLLSGENTTWEAWRAKWPGTAIAAPCHEAIGGYLSRRTMDRLLRRTMPRVTPPGKVRLDGLPPKTTVFGLRLNGEAMAYPLSRLEARPAFDDVVGGVPLALRYDPDARFLTVETGDGTPPPMVEKHWWLGWKEFNPSTRIWPG